MVFSDITIFIFGSILGVICTLLLINRSKSTLREENQILKLKIKHQDELDKKYLVKTLVSYLNQVQREEILDDLKREVF